MTSLSQVGSKHVNLIHMLQNSFQRLADVSAGIIVRISIKMLTI
jgi:hypothetical protein